MEGQQAKQGQIGRQHKTIGVAGITAGQGNSLANDMMEGRSEGTAKGGRGWIVSARARRKAGRREWCVTARRAGQDRAG